MDFLIFIKSLVEIDSIIWQFIVIFSSAMLFNSPYDYCDEGIFMGYKILMPTILVLFALLLIFLTIDGNSINNKRFDKTRNFFFILILISSTLGFICFILKKTAFKRSECDITIRDFTIILLFGGIIVILINAIIRIRIFGNSS